MQWLLSMLCRAPVPETAPYIEVPQEPLALLRREFSEYFPRFQGARIVDFGSGWGFQSVALAKEGAKEIVALETGEEKRKHTSQLAAREGVKVQSLPRISPQDYGTFDFVLSLDSMEHFSSPKEILQEMTKLLKPGGRLLISFGPPWYSPYGAHLTFMTKVPWIQLFFSEDALMRARARYRNDGARSFAEVDGGLNQMSVRAFESLISSAELQFERRRYRCVWSLGFLAWIPLLRELFINQVSVVARKRI